MKKIAVGKLILDYSLYPRSDVDTQHIAYMREADDAGVIFPPIIIDKKSKCVTDGFHRVKMYKYKYGDEHMVDVIEKDYANEAEMFLDAIRYNANHGRTLSRHDRTHCILLAETINIPQDELASALSMTIEKIGELRIDRVGQMKVGKTVKSIPLKRTIRHMQGRRLTKAQGEVNEKLSGMNQVFYVNQIIMLIESNLLDKANEQLFQRLDVLRKLLTKLDMTSLAKVV